MFYHVTAADTMSITNSKDPALLSRQPPSLIEISLEVLYRIFQFTLKSDQDFIDISSKADNSCSSQLVRTCRHLYASGIPFLYTKNRFLARTDENDTVVLPSLELSARNQIKHLRADGYPSSHALQTMQSLRTLQIYLQYSSNIVTVSENEVRTKLIGHLLKFSRGYSYLQSLGNTLLSVKVHFTIEVLFANPPGPRVQRHPGTIFDQIAQGLLQSEVTKEAPVVTYQVPNLP